jgi:putative FmdB family regulatory protein
MPLYEYACDHCGHRFEKIQKFSDPLVDTCPKCGSGPVHKLLSSPAIQFKGSGWYITDYAKKDGGAAKAGSDGSKEAKAADSGQDGKGASDTTKDAKPTAETTAKAPDTKAT